MYFYLKFIERLRFAIIIFSGADYKLQDYRCKFWSKQKWWVLCLWWQSKRSIQGCKRTTICAVNRCRWSSIWDNCVLWQRRKRICCKLNNTGYFSSNGPVHNGNSESKRRTNNLEYMNRKSGGLSNSVRVTRNCVPDFFVFFCKFNDTTSG